MFEVDGRYANRHGVYTVLAISPPTMTVRYDDGTIAELRINIQERIWENIQADVDTSARREQSRQRRSPTGTRFYIKSIPAISEDDLQLPGLREYLVIFDDLAVGAKTGDRFIYLAQEQGVIFAVATITGPAAPLKGAAYNERTEGNVFPIDVDASAGKLSQAVSADSIDLDSQPEFVKKLAAEDSMIEITEDEFELVAELLTEVSEEDDDDLADLDDEEDDEPEIEV